MRVHATEIDAVICAAGIQGPIGPFAETPLNAWTETLETNLVGVANTLHAALPEMIRSRRGKIIALAGGGASTPRPNFSAYAASKSALARFVESVAEELRDHNVQINCMAPGGAYTHMTDEILRAGDKAGWKEHEEATRIRISGGVPAEKQIALAKFLISERSNHVSGKIIHVQDDWKRLENSNVNPEIYTLRRIAKM
jgi:3-oxoacyl-[acyl-carrier protein] reductase